MSELHDQLALATDRIVSPRLEHVALRTARRRRARRGGAVAAVLVSAVVATVAVGTHTGGGSNSGLPPAAPSPTPTPTPSSAPEQGDDEKVWPRWDPREVDRLAAAPARIAPALPEVIDPPASSPPLIDDPVSAAVLSVEQGDFAQILGTDGGWRSVQIDGRFPVLSLSPDGTRLAVYYSYDDREPEHDYGVTVYDLANGSARTLAAPDGFEPWDSAGWSFLDEGTLLCASGPTAYAVDVDSGKTEETTVPAGMSVARDPDGNWLASADFDEPNVLTDYAGGAPREVSMDRTGRLQRIQADQNTVVGTTYDNSGGFWVVVADRETLTPESRLSVVDFDGNYSNWGLGTLALSDDGTVLLRVAAIGRRVDGFRVVAWDPLSGGLSIVSSTSLPVEVSVVFAQAMLREVGSG